MEKENKKECKKFIDSAWFYFIVSIAIILYLIYIVTPYANETNMFSEGPSPNKSELAIYRLMIWPIFIIYLVYAFKKVKTFKLFTKVWIYPLTELTFLILIFYFLPSLGGGTYLWLLFFIIPFLPILLIIELKVIIKAISEKIKNKK